MISAYGFQWKQRRMGGMFDRLYHNAKDRESFKEEEWITYQNKELQKLLEHAFITVPYYNRIFKQSGFTNDSIAKITVEDIAKLPILTKEELRKYGTTEMVSTKREKHGEFFSSSGSTGTPTKILFSYPMHQRWYAIFEARVRNWAGVDSMTPRGMIGGRRIISSSKNEAPFYRYNYFEKQVYFSAYHISKGNAYNYLHGINKYNVQYMTGYAMSNFFLARIFKELDIEAPHLKAVITSSEKLTHEMRKIFREVYYCKTFDGWSGVEACGLITECENGCLHISPDAGIIEVLNNNMKPVSFGESGQVYCTGLLNYDQPLIRYAIGDEIILSNKKCQCGRNMPVVQEIIGRVEDVIRGRDGREMVRFHGIFNGLVSVKKAQVIQENIDILKIKIVPDVKLNNVDEKLIRHRIESQLGDINVEIEEVDEIPLNNNGKYQAVISKLKRTVTNE